MEKKEIINTIYKLLREYRKTTGKEARAIYMNPITFNEIIATPYVKKVSTICGNFTIIFDTPIFLKVDCPVTNIYVGEYLKEGEE